MAGGFHIYSHIPIYEAGAPESGVFLTWVGKCCTSNESHGYWWKINSNNHSNGNNNNSATTKNDVQQSGSKGKSVLVNSTPTSTPPSGGKLEQSSGRWGETLSSYFGAAARKGASTDSLLHAPPKGKSALQRQQPQAVSRQKADGADGLTGSDGSNGAGSAALPPSPPLGLGVVFFTEEDVVTGILIAGYPTKYPPTHPPTHLACSFI